MSVVRLILARWPKVAAFVGFACPMFAGEAIAAPVLNPANGHYYEWISAPGGITWTAAKAAAEASTHLGQSGYLVTFTDSSEEAFVYSLPGVGTGWGGASDAAVEGEWRWQGGPEVGTLFWTGGTSGTASGYENWTRDNSMTVYLEPNSVGDEDCLWLRPGTDWADAPCANTETRYVVEYESPACGTFLLKWGTPGSGDGQFDFPNGIAVDGNGDVFVADTGNGRVQKFTSTGAFLLKWGSGGSGDGQFMGPYGLAVDGSNNVFVGDTNNARVQKFANNGAFLLKWGSPGAGDGQFSTVEGVAVDSSGNVYVADFGGNRVHKFTNTGSFLAKWGAPGSADGQFNNPLSIAVDASDNVYVSDYSNHRVQKFTNTGVFLTKWGGPTAGAGDGQFNSPFGVTVDASGNVLVADANNHRVQKFTNTGTFISKWGGPTPSSADGQFNFPSHLTTDGNGHVFVSDANNNRIQKFACPLPTTTSTTSTSTSSTTSTTLAPPELIPGRIGIVKPTTLAKFVAKPATGDTFALPSGDPLATGGSLRILDTATGAGDNTYNLPSSGWKGLGNPVGSKGYKYKGAGTPTDPCKVVLLKATVIKGVCKGSGIALTTPFAGEVGIILSLGTTDRYCASFGGEDVKNDTTLTKRKNAPAPADCPTPPTTSTTSSTSSSTTTSTSSTTTTSLQSGCFVDIGDGTIYDTCTNLQWEKKTNAAGLNNVNNKYSWAGCCGGSCGSTADLCQPTAGAAALCAANSDGGTEGCNTCTVGTCVVDALSQGAITTAWEWLNQLNAANFAGHNDWRLPSEGNRNAPSTGTNELETILLSPFPCGTDPCINSIFGPTNSLYYWSASTLTGTGFNAWRVAFVNGSVSNEDKRAASDRYVRAVRAQ